MATYSPLLMALSRRTPAAPVEIRARSGDYRGHGALCGSFGARRRNSSRWCWRS